MAALSKEEYLKRYLSNSDSGTKKKRKKKVKAGVKPGKSLIIDDDVNLSDIRVKDDNESQGNLLELAEEKPLIFDEDGATVLSKDLEIIKKNEEARKAMWAPMKDLTEGDRFQSPHSSTVGDASLTCTRRNEEMTRRKRHDNLSPETNKGSGSLELSPARNTRSNSPKISHEKSKSVKSDRGRVGGSPPRMEAIHDLEDMPPRRKTRHDSEDMSPLRRKAAHDSTDMSPPRRKTRHDSEDMSPPRRKAAHDSADISPPRRKAAHDSTDMSPPRRKTRHDSEDMSPPRRKAAHGSTDMSPPRRKTRHDSEDMSPPRRKAAHGSADMSPPRRTRHDSGDISPPRRRTRHDSEDMSPPRKGRHDSSFDQSPPRRNKPNAKHNSPDLSPPRKTSNLKGNASSNQSLPRKKDSSNNRGAQNKRIRHDSPDQSPPRQKKTKDHGSDVSYKKEEDMSPKQKEPAKHVRKAGLHSGAELRRENQLTKRRETEMFLRMSSSATGKGAETVHRDREGRRRDLTVEKEKRKEDERKKLEEDEKFMEWGKGLQQTKEAKEKVHDDVYEMSKPLARYQDDKDLDSMLRDRDRAGDPMLAFMQKKRVKQDAVSGKKEKPKYKGPAPPPNRFNLQPGYRWDGVDRSNGFEKKRFTMLANKGAMRDEAYKWSTEDM